MNKEKSNEKNVWSENFDSSLFDFATWIGIKFEKFAKNIFSLIIFFLEFTSSKFRVTKVFS